jgi:tellurite resistance protein TerC
MGLRQLYFLLGGLLKRLIYLSLGLAFILAFIGLKLVLHALHENELPFINDGQPVHVWDIPSLVSLAVILLTLGVTAAASLYVSRNMSEEEIAERTSSLQSPDEKPATE